MSEEKSERAAPQPVAQWRCFHCDEVFTSVVTAAFHFGYADLEKPACLVDAVELRNLQLELRRYREEDTDLHRAIHAEESKGLEAARRAEEQGYARGLADAKKHPEELGLYASPVLPEAPKAPATWNDIVLTIPTAAEREELRLFILNGPDEDKAFADGARAMHIFKALCAHADGTAATTTEEAPKE